MPCAGTKCVRKNEIRNRLFDGRRGERHDASPAVCLHPGDNAIDEVEHAPQRVAIRRVPIVGFDIEIFSRLWAAAVRNENLHITERRPHIGEQLLHRCRVREVHDKAARIRRAAALRLACDLIESLAAARGERHRRPFICQRQRRGFPKSGARAGDERHAPPNPQIHSERPSYTKDPAPASPRRVHRLADDITVVQDANIASDRERDRQALCAIETIHRYVLSVQMQVRHRRSPAVAARANRRSRSDVLADVHHDGTTCQVAEKYRAECCANANVIAQFPPAHGRVVGFAGRPAIGHVVFDGNHLAVDRREDRASKARAVEANEIVGEDLVTRHQMVVVQWIRTARGNAPLAVERHPEAVRLHALRHPVPPPPAFGTRGKRPEPDRHFNANHREISLRNRGQARRGKEKVRCQADQQADERDHEASPSHQTDDGHNRDHENAGRHEGIHTSALLGYSVPHSHMRGFASVI
jgi:hypothetical protein